MNKEEITELLKNHLKITAERRGGYVGMGGPQDGDDSPGDIHIELWFNEELISSTSVGEW